MRWVFKFFLSLCVLLLGSHALTSHGYLNYTVKKGYDSPTPATYSYAHNRKARIGKTVPSNAGKISNRIKATEVEEEEEALSFKRHSETVNFCITFFDMEVSAGNKEQPQLPFCEHFSYASSDKFIVHRVIRI